jgi:hypothetical protein
MGKTLPRMVSVSSLIEMAALHPAGGGPEENHMSYPMPVPGREGLCLAFLYCVAAPDEREGWWISVPTYLCLWQAETGAFEELRAFNPIEFALPPTQHQWLGTYLSPQERQTLEFRSKQDQLFRCYDALLAPFAASVAEVSSETRTAAREFRSLSPALFERLLLPYYQALGGRFLDWARRAAG